MTGGYLIHWFHPVRHNAACSKRIPYWAMDSLISEVGCQTCQRVHDAYMRRELAKPGAPVEGSS